MCFLYRQEKANALPVTRQSTGKLPPARQFEVQQSSNSSSSTGTKTIIVSSNATPEEIKAKMEEQLRIQRAAHHQKRAMELKAQGKTRHPFTLLFHFFPLVFLMLDVSSSCI